MSSEKVELKLDWCSYEAAKYACEHWHYSKCMPVGKTVKIGVWENKKYIGEYRDWETLRIKIGRAHV